MMILEMKSTPDQLLGLFWCSWHLGDVKGVLTAGWFSIIDYRNDDQGDNDGDDDDKTHWDKELPVVTK